MSLNVFLTAIIAALLFIIIYPLVRVRNAKVKKLPEFPLHLSEAKVLIAALKMVKSRKVFMAFNDDLSLYVMLAKLKAFIKGDKAYFKYTFYNFPRAWLLLGILEYACATEDEASIEVVKEQCSDYIDAEGNLRFTFDKLDQVLFGLLFLKMYSHFGDARFKRGAENIYETISRFKSSEGTYLYREGLQVLFVDTLGMLVPFLFEYAKVLDAPEKATEAVRQIRFYSELLVAKDAKHLPVHAFDLEAGIHLGSSNWSRGVAWYFIGLAYALQYGIEDYREEFNLLAARLFSLRKGMFWPQFLAHTDDNSIDSSSTTMLYYALALGGFDIFDALEGAMKYAVSTDGFVEYSSGDTFYINKYSRVKGKSELTQGILLLLLAHRKQAGVLGRSVH